MYQKCYIEQSSKKSAPGAPKISWKSTEESFFRINSWPSSTLRHDSEHKYAVFNGNA